MPHIFISYRRDDSNTITGRLYDRVCEEFHDRNVFRDIHDIGPGEIFRPACEEAVRSCEVLIAVIGKLWITIEDSTGKRRLDNPDDLVRKEIALALSQDYTLVIPTLVDGASIPNIEKLPDDLKPLLERNVYEIRDKEFEYDMQKLIREINKTWPIEDRLRQARWSEKITYEQEMMVRGLPPSRAEELFNEMLQEAPVRKKILDEMRAETMRNILDALRRNHEGKFRISCTLVTRKSTEVRVIIDCHVLLPRTSSWSLLSSKGWIRDESGRWFKEYHMEDRFDANCENQLIEIASEIIAANGYAGVPAERIFVDILNSPSP